MADQELITIPDASVRDVFTTEGALDPYLQRIRDEVDAFVPDLTTDKGRKEIASMAYRIARSKTHLDDLGKELVADMKKEPAKVDAVRKAMRDKLQGWQAEVRKPLDDWEAAERLRIEVHTQNIDGIKRLAHPTHDDGTPFSADELRSNLALLSVIDLSEHKCAEFADEYRIAVETGESALDALIKTAERREAETAELEELRRKDAERDAEDARRAAQEAQDRAEAAAATKAREETEAAAAAQRRDAEAAAEKEREAAAAREAQLQREKEEADQRAADAAATARQEEAERLAREKADADARAADTANRTRKHREATQDVIDYCNLDRVTAELVVEKIAEGRIVHVKIEY